MSGVRECHNKEGKSESMFKNHGVFMNLLHFVCMNPGDINNAMMHIHKTKNTII